MIDELFDYFESGKKKTSIKKVEEHEVTSDFCLITEKKHKRCLHLYFI